MTLLAELKRRNVIRAAVLYAGAVWALAQGVAQLAPLFGDYDWIARWFVIAGVIGFPFWIAFAWFYEITPGGLKRESEFDPTDAVDRGGNRRLDAWTIGVLAVAVVLLLTNQFIGRKDTATTTATPAPASTYVPGKSIAVLPLANESGDKDQQFFSDGLSEDLITALSQFNGLKVISRNSSFQFRDSKDDASMIGRKLGVAHLLEGSVRRVGDTVRVSAQLVNVADSSTLWSQHYDRPYQDLFALQDEITNAVAMALRAKLLSVDGAVVQSDHPPSGSLLAYRQYIQGNFYAPRGSEADFRRAIDHYQQAILLDPGYARAYVALADTRARFATVLLGGQERLDSYRRARVAVSSALSLDPNLAAAYNARGFLLTYSDFDWNGGERAFRRALQLAPNDGTAQGRLAFLLAAAGKPTQAAALARRALTTDPLNAGGYLQLSRYLSATGRLDQAMTAIRRALELQPGAASYREQLVIIEVLRGDAQAASRAAQQDSPGPWQRTELALARQLGTDRGAANAALQALIDQDADTAAYQIAQVFALRKQPDKAFEWLDRAWDDRDPGISLLLFDPFLLRYRDDPRFAAFCRKVGLPVPVPGVVQPATTASTP